VHAYTLFLCHSHRTEHTLIITGAEGYPVELIADIVGQAAAGLQAAANTSIYDRAFGELASQLPSVSRADLIHGFALAIEEQIGFHTTPGSEYIWDPDLTHALLELAQSADLDEAIAAGFALVCHLLAPKLETDICHEGYAPASLCATSRSHASVA